VQTSIRRTRKYNIAQTRRSEYMLENIYVT